MTQTKTTVLIEVEVPSTTRPLATRARILAPYLERLGIGADADGKAVELPAIVDADDYILELDDWERSVLRDHPAGTDAKGRPWPRLVSESLAFQMRYIERVAFFDGAEVPASEHAEVIGHLIIDGAIGITLLDDLQWAINRLIREGQVQVAGRLADFRNAVNQNVSRVRSYADAETFAIDFDANRDGFAGVVGEVQSAVVVSGEEEGVGGDAFLDGLVHPDRAAADRGAEVVDLLRVHEPEVGL